MFSFFFLIKEYSSQTHVRTHIHTNTRTRAREFKRIKSLLNFLKISNKYLGGSRVRYWKIDFVKKEFRRANEIGGKFYRIEITEDLGSKSRLSEIRVEN